MSGEAGGGYRYPDSKDEATKPRKSEQRQRSVVVSVRFTPDEFMAVAQKTGGLPVSTYLRELAMAIDDASALRRRGGPS